MIGRNVQEPGRLAEQLALVPAVMLGCACPGTAS